ncbi:MAG: hypothetical protein DME18_05545 [Verrucomicrobia bacterium]|nr:MAG: hypothetical protein DME18_05545 [Verrucomicrobiota bacterium]
MARDERRENIVATKVAPSDSAAADLDDAIQDRAIDSYTLSLRSGFGGGGITDAEIRIQACYVRQQ